MTTDHSTRHDDPEPHQAHYPDEDEWGFFDPERHGLAAVRARIGAAHAPAETPRETLAPRPRLTHGDE